MDRSRTRSARRRLGSGKHVEEPKEHQPVVLFAFQQITPDATLQTTPFLLVVCLAGEDRDEIGLLEVKIGEMEAGGPAG